MTTIKRGFRSMRRHPFRSGLLAALLAVSIGLTLIMITVDRAFALRMDEIKDNVGTEVDVLPAGSFGPMMGAQNGRSLAADDVAKLDGIEHVESITQTLVQPMVETNLETGRNFVIAGDSGDMGDGKPIPTIGTDNADALVLPTGGAAQVVEGRTFRTDELDANVALVAALMAQENGLVVGDTFELQGESFEIVGTTTSEGFLGDNSIFLPLATAQRLFDLEGQVSAVSLRADSIDNVEEVATEVEFLMGSDDVDVGTSLDRYEEIAAPLADARDASRLGLISALITSALVILFAMVLAARQRIREIGILKALGAANRHVALQFGVETLAIAFVAAVLGALLTFPAAQAVADGLVSDPSSGQPAEFGMRAGQPEAGAVRVDGGGIVGDALGSIDVAVSPEIFLYALGLAVALALVASAVPVWHVARIKPAEVLRYE